MREGCRGPWQSIWRGGAGGYDKLNETVLCRHLHGILALRRSFRIADSGNNTQGSYEGSATPNRLLYGT